MKARFAWAMIGLSPCSTNSFWQKVLAKKPRLSSCLSRSKMQAPLSFVSVNIMFYPLLDPYLRVFFIIDKAPPGKAQFSS
ncbi:MAG: hypothetical protein NTY03_01350 [Candidatus Bathyarchaeota archaeon]|nr:hypothetical protein [Candidatus Bathyarchaeota archaeon]